MNFINSQSQNENFATFKPNTTGKESKKVAVQQQKTFAEKVENSIQKKFHKQIFSKFCKAINEYQLLNKGDKVAVCISGGKDSMLLAKLFQELKKHNKFQFDLIFLCMDPGYNKNNRQKIEDNAKNLNIPLTIFESNIFKNVEHIEKSPCYLCARMRRGHLYAKAKELGCNKIALGHHFDDVIETILMGMLYGGQIQTMMPKLKSTNFEGMELIRPLYLVREEDIIRWRDDNGLEFLRCACRFTEKIEEEFSTNWSKCELFQNAEHSAINNCDGVRNSNLPLNAVDVNAKITQTPKNLQNNLQPNVWSESKRKEIKLLISNLKKTNPQVEKNIFKSVENVNLSTIVAFKDKEGKLHHFLDEF